MPVERNLKTARDHARRQFEDYLGKSRASNGQAKRVPLAPEHHELLYSENAGSDQGVSLLFDARPEHWLQRQISRREVRNEVARLINAQFGDQALIVERRFLPDETIGDRIMKDSATPSGFSFNRIDDAAMDRIARRINAVHNAIKTHNGKHPHEEANGEKKPFLVSKAMLKSIYQQAREDAPIDPANINSEEAAAAIPIAFHEYKDNEPRLVVDAPLLSTVSEENGRASDQDVAVVANQAQKADDNNLPTDRGAEAFALSQDYRRGTHGRERDRDQGAYYLVLAFQMGNEDAENELRELLENGDRKFQQAIAKVYCEGRGDVDQEFSEAAYWLARSWQGLKAAHPYTDWAKALYTEDSATPNLPNGALEFALSQILLTGAEHLDRTPNKAAYFLLLAAEKGNKSAADRLAQLAATKAPEGNDLSLQLSLYQIYRKGGEDINQDQTQAVLWLARAHIEPDHHDRAALHFPQSTFRTRLRRDKNFKLEYAPEEMACDLGRFYKTGHAEIPRDVDKAAYFLAFAAEAGNKDAIAALKVQKGEVVEQRQHIGLRTFLVPTKDSDPALQYALHEVYRKGADGIERNMAEAGPWLMRAMRVTLRVSSTDPYSTFVEFGDNCDGGPWEGLPQSIKDARSGSSRLHNRDFDLWQTYRDFELWKIYSHGTDDIQQDMYAAVYWLTKAREEVIAPSLLINHVGLLEIVNTFDALSWQDFKRYADPSFYRNLTTEIVGGTGANYRRHLRQKLEKAVSSGNDPEAVYELAQLDESHDGGTSF